MVDAEIAPQTKDHDSVSAQSEVFSRIGQVALVMSGVARYRALSLDQFVAAVIEPLRQKRVIFLARQGADAAFSGLAIWASASSDVSARIAELARCGKVPIELGSGDWTSGPDIWLLDIVAPDRAAGTAIFNAFGRVIDGRAFRVHPIVYDQIDPLISQNIRNAAAKDSMPAVERDPVY